MRCRRRVSPNAGSMEELRVCVPVAQALEPSRSGFPEILPKGSNLLSEEREKDALRALVSMSSGGSNRRIEATLRTTPREGGRGSVRLLQHRLWHRCNRLLLRGCRQCKLEGIMPCPPRRRMRRYQLLHRPRAVGPHLDLEQREAPRMLLAPCLLIHPKEHKSIVPLRVFLLPTYGQKIALDITRLSK